MQIEFKLQSEVQR